MAFSAVIIGLLAGFSAYIFKKIIEFLSVNLLAIISSDNMQLLYIVYPLLGVILVSLFVKYIVKDDIDEGIVKVLYAMSKNESKIKSHNSFSSLLAGSTTMGFGGSVGPEAPIVLGGASIGSNFAKFMRMNYRNRTILLCSGAAAGLAAIFKAPIAAIVFVLEILMLDITAASVMPLLISSVSATTLIFFLEGVEPVFNMITVSGFGLKNIPYYIILGLICGLISYYFTKTNFFMINKFSKIKSLYKKWALGGTLIGVLVFIFPPLYGEGYGAIKNLVDCDFYALFSNSIFVNYTENIYVVLIFLVAIAFLKIVAASLTNAAGGIGGMFAPSLFTGAFVGGALAYFLNKFVGLNLPINSFCLVGMAGMMSGVMKAPLTAVFLIAEISFGYGLFLPLMIVSSSAFSISYHFDKESIYTKKLAKKGELLTHNKDQSAFVLINLVDLIKTDYETLGDNSLLKDALRFVANSSKDIFPVLNSDKNLLGVIRLDEIREVMFNKEKYNNSIFDYMLPVDEFIVENDSVLNVVSKFEKTKVDFLPVLDRNNKYLGFINRIELLVEYRNELKEISL